MNRLSVHKNLYIFFKPNTDKKRLIYGIFFNVKSFIKLCVPSVHTYKIHIFLPLYGVIRCRYDKIKNFCSCFSVNRFLKYICSHLYTSVHICSRFFFWYPFISVHICSHLFTSVHTFGGICTHFSVYLFTFIY